MTTADPRLDSPRSWAVAAAAATGMFAVYSVAYSFGAFFSSMAESFDASSSATALFFSLTICLSFMAAPYTGRWVDRVGPRPVMLTAAASLCFGLLATAAVPTIWLGYLSYGIGVGFAIACAYVPMVAVVGGWFDRRRGAALGIAVAGIGLGTLFGNPVAARLISATSWRTTYVIFGLGGGALLVAASFVVARGPAAVNADAPQPLRELLRRSDFAILYVGTLFATFGLFIPFVFVVDYAESEGIGEVAAASLVGIIGGASVAGRLGLGGLADRVPTIKLSLFSVTVMAFSHVLWLGAGDRYVILVTYAIVLGFGYGGVIALGPAVAAERFGMEGLGGVLGSLYTAAGISALVSPPIAGVFVDEIGYSAAVLVALTTSVIGSATVIPLVRGSH